MAAPHVHLGRIRLGTIHQDDAGEYLALDLTDRRLGRFRTRAEALAALPDRPILSSQAATKPASSPRPHQPGRDRGLFLGLRR